MFRFRLPSVARACPVHRKTPAVLSVLAVLAPAAVHSGPTDNVFFRARLDEHSGYSDVWGYTAPNGDEYALLGTHTGTAVINVSTPSVPYETAFLPGPTSERRDIKTYGSFAYVVNEGNGGMQIIDLSDPEDPRLASTYGDGGLVTAHNLFIDGTTGHAYVFGFNTNGGVILLDLSSPTAPVEIARWDQAYLHDGMVHSGRLFACAIFQAKLRVLDVTDPQSIVELGTAEGYPEAYTHNAWTTPDGAYVMTTDETSLSSCRMWDLSTLPNLVQTDFYRPVPGVIPHNVHIEGTLAFLSYYTLGVKIVDVSDPHALVEVASYDTRPEDDGSSYEGCWGVFPYFQTNSDLIVASDIRNGLFVLEYVGALGTLAGSVSEAGAPAVGIHGATVEILGSGETVTTDETGAYLVQDVSGAAEVRVGAFGYVSTTVPATLVAGVTTLLDVALDALPRGTLTGVVSEAPSGFPMEGVRVEVVGTPLADTTDASGNYVFDPVPAGTWLVRAFALGANPAQAGVVVTAGMSTTADLALGPAPYYADFESTPSGWFVTTTAIRGAWEIADPQGTYSDGIPIQPEFDHTPSPGTMCWVTDGSAGSGPGSWDVDGGATVLTSNSFSTFGMAHPHVRYYRWYSSGVGNPHTDPFLVEMSTNSGVTWPIVLEDTSMSTNAWIEVDFALNDLAPPPSSLRFRFTAQDTGNGGLIEAALDDFMIYEGFEVPGTTVPTPPRSDGGFRLGPVWPNPNLPGRPARTELLLWREDRVTASVFDVAGRRVATLFDRRLEPGVHIVTWSGRLDAGGTATTGLYFLRVHGAGDDRVRKLLLIR